MKITMGKAMKYYESNRIRFFLLAVLLFEILFFVLCFISRGEGLYSVFFNNKTDTFADFYKPMFDWWGNAYENPTQEVNYPPLAVMFFQCFRRMVSSPAVSGLDYRNYSDAWIPFIYYNLTCVLIFFFCLVHCLREMKEMDLFLTTTVCMFSVPVLYTFERGNIILLAFSLSLFFCTFYSSKNLVLKELAFFSLALAAGIKIYPAVFGIMLIKEKRWKEACRLVGYGIVCCFLPFLFFGAGAIKAFFRGTESFFEMHQFFSSYSLRSFCHLFMAVTGIEVSNIFFEMIWVLMLLGLLLCTLTAQSGWESMLACALIIIVLPATSFAYTKLFLLVAFIFLLKDCRVIETRCNEKEIKSKRDWYVLFVFIAYFLLLIPWISNNIERFTQGFRTISYTEMMYIIVVESLAITAVIRGFIRAYHYIDRKNPTKQVCDRN